MTLSLTTAQAFAKLNDLRKQNGKAPLKAFKDSRAKLEAAINKEFEMTLGEIAKREGNHTDAELKSIDNRGKLPSDDIADTSSQGTSKPEKTAALKAARIENDRKNAALEKLEKEQTSPSAVNHALKSRQAKQREIQPKATKPAKKTVPAKSRPGVKSGEPSAAEVAGEFGIQPKVARALLRKHNVARTADAMRAFFKARAK